MAKGMVKEQTLMVEVGEMREKKMGNGFERMAGGDVEKET